MAGKKRPANPKWEFWRNVKRYAPAAAQGVYNYLQSPTRAPSGPSGPMVPYVGRRFTYKGIRRNNMSRIGRTKTIRLGRPKSLRALGVGQVHNRYYCNTEFSRSEASGFSRVKWIQATAYGHLDKDARDNMYVNEGLDDSDNVLVHLNSTSTWVVKNQSDMAVHCSMYLIYCKHDYDDTL